jgi:hypothetical protein
MKPASVVAAVAGALSITVAAQELTGTMSGVVKDAQGAVLRGVTGSLQRPSSAARTAVTSEAGTYQVRRRLRHVHRKL